MPLQDTCSACVGILLPRVGKGLLHLLDRVQGFAARLVTGHWSADWSLLCSELGWCQLVQRRKCAKIQLCRNILLGNSIIPSSVFSRSKCPRSSRYLKHSLQLHQPFVRTSYHQQSFFINSVGLWNSLPPEIVGLSSDLAFKRHLKHHLCVTQTNP